MQKEKYGSLEHQKGTDRDACDAGACVLEPECITEAEMGRDRIRNPMENLDSTHGALDLLENTRIAQCSIGDFGRAGDV